MNDYRMGVIESRFAEIIWIVGIAVILAPQYFDLDDSNGLDVYVWQLAENSYYFGLLPHTATSYIQLSW